MAAAITAAAIAAGAGYGVAAITGTLATYSFVSAFATSLVLGVLSRAMQKKPQQAEQASIASQGRLLNIRQPISSWQIIPGRARVGGTITFVETVSRGDGGTNNILNVVVTYAGHVCEAVDEIYVNDEIVTFDGDGSAIGRYYGYLNAEVSLGDEAGQPFHGLASGWSDGKWTDAHRQSGRTKIWFRMVASPDLWPTGIPTFTAVIKGAKIYDTRTATTAWSNNAALWVAHYLANTTYGLGAVYADEIDTDDLDASANICEENVTLAAGGSEDRYTVNGAFLTSEQPKDVIERLLAAMAGRAVNQGAAWHIYAGAYYAPTVTLDEGDLAGPIRVQSLVSRRESCNGVKGVFTDPNSSWQPTDFPAIASDTYMALDNNERVWRDVDFSGFVTSGTQAQRLAKIELLRTRQGLTAAATHKLTAFGVVPGRTAALTNTKFGWSAKAFDVESSTFSVAEDGALNVDLSFRETAASIYDWSTSEEQAVDAAPNTTLPDPFTVTAPGTLAISEVLYDTTGSAGVKSRAILSWTGQDPFAVSYSVEYKLAAATDYTVAPTVQATTQWLDDLAPGIYTFRHRAVSGITGVRSAYSPVVTKELIGLTAPPSDLTNFSLTPIGNQADLSWDKLTANSDLDVLIGGRIMVRWTPLTSGATWNDGFEIGPPGGVPGDATSARVPHLTGTYMGRARDSSGNQSVSMVAVITTAPDVIDYNAVATLTEDATFTGTKSSVVVVDGKLTLDGGVLIDDMPGSIDDWGYIDSFGGVAASGTYDFSTYIDLGATYTSRATATLKTLSIDTGDLIDYRLDPIDDWGMVDGPEISDVNAVLYVATTTDDPAGAPTWSSWRPFIVGDYKCRAFKFRLVLTSDNLNHNIQVINLRVAVDMPDREDAARNVASGTGTYSVVYTLSPGFKALPKIGITAKNMGTGDYFTITSEAVTGFDIAFKNSAAAGVSRNFDWRVKGY